MSSFLNESTWQVQQTIDDEGFCMFPSKVIVALKPVKYIKSSDLLEDSSSHILLWWRTIWS